MSERKVYLDDIPFDEAWKRFTTALANVGKWSVLSSEKIALDEALGRITAEPVWAAVSSPAYHASAMDGYAVRADDTQGATETKPIRLKLGGQDQAYYVDTGDPLPAWADSVVMIEHAQMIDKTAIEIRASVAPWTNVRSMGEDMVATELVLPANHDLRPVDLGAIAGCGHASVVVRRKPRVAVIPTGTELIAVKDVHEVEMKPGVIIEYNSLVLAAQVEQWGGVAVRYPIIEDDFARIRAVADEAAAKHDLVLIIAGSSAGSEDYTARVVEESGDLLVHGIAVKPGHPVILGLLRPESESAPSVPVIGVPGYPVSCALTGETILKPLLARWLGVHALVGEKIEAAITRKLHSSMGDDEWVRVSVGKVGTRTVAAPLSRGAGVIMSLVRADGIVCIPRFSEGVEAGQNVIVNLYCSRDEIERTIVHIGSHDLCLDLLSQALADQSPPAKSRRLVSANAGSLGGLVALRRGEAHFAGSHLLDPATGEYNLSYVKQHLPETPVVLVTFVHREQGLIVSPGNPKKIRNFEDVARTDVRFVNRQRGAGTRILFDYRIRQLGIHSEEIRGYDREEYTHLAVAAAVKSGVADCGLGIAAAARALELDFIPLEQERYDLVIPEVYYQDELLQPLLDVIRGQEFPTAVAQLAGYDTTHSGTVVEI